MTHLKPAAHRLAFPLLCTVLCLRTLGDPGAFVGSTKIAFPAAMPQIVVWAWEEPEDLRSAPPSTVGVAYLAETLLLGTREGERGSGPRGGPAVSILPRRQPLAVAPGASVMAVVRIVTLPGFDDSEAMREETASALAEVARQPGLRAFQVDFDATRSQYAFYTAVLRRLHPQMPTGMPLSITALVSWCATTPGNGDWISALPIEEAVPMFFRMGGRSRPGDDKSGYPLRAPVCRGSVGISTDESWPAIREDERIYVFAPQPWSPAQLVALDGIRFGLRSPTLSVHAEREAIDDTGLAARRTNQTYDSSEKNLP